MKNQKLANFLFEAATLKRLKRTGWQILGENEESVAEHSFMVAIISIILAKEEKANTEKVLLMSLLHDIAEARTGDVYKLADLYVKTDTAKAVRDVFSDFSYRDELTEIIQEYEEKNTHESQIVHEADALALCLELKQLMEKGNMHAGEWFEGNKKRLHLDVSLKLWEEIKKTNSQDWWKKERNKIHKSF